jgi:hypothetical protein
MPNYLTRRINMDSETWAQTLTVCDRCSELLNHSVQHSHKTTEIRVEACPECSQPGLKLSADQLDLVLRMIKHVKPKALKFMVFSLADYNNLVEIENKIKGKK